MSIYSTFLELTSQVFLFFPRVLSFIKSRHPHQTAPSVQTSWEPYSQPRCRALRTLQDSSQSCLLHQQQQLQLQPHLQVPNMAFMSCIINNHRTKIVLFFYLFFLKSWGRKKYSPVTSWSCLTFPHFSTWIRYKSNLCCCLREKQGDFGDLRDLDCGSGNVQHNEEWVGGWIKLRLFFIISSLAAGWDYIGHDLAVVGINEDLI